jgi:hypothetical protein
VRARTGPISPGLSSRWASLFESLDLALLQINFFKPRKIEESKDLHHW